MSEDSKRGYLSLGLDLLVKGGKHAVAAAACVPLGVLDWAEYRAWYLDLKERHNQTQDLLDRPRRDWEANRDSLWSYIGGWYKNLTF